MKPGTKPRATNLKILYGEKNKDRINKNEPKPKPVLPQCPAHLDSGAKYVWKKLGNKLLKLGILTEVDEIVFANLCQAYSRIKAIQRKLKQKNTQLLYYKVTVDNDGDIHKEPKQNPLLTAERQYMQTLRMYAAEIGISPSARSRIVGNADDKDDEFEGLLSK